MPCSFRTMRIYASALLSANTSIETTVQLNVVHRLDGYTDSLTKQRRDSIADLDKLPEELCGPTYFVNFGLQFTGVQGDEQLSLEEVGQLVLRDLGDGDLPGRCLHKKCGQEDAVPLGRHRNARENTLGTLSCSNNVYMHRI